MYSGLNVNILITTIIHDSDATFSYQKLKQEDHKTLLRKIKLFVVVFIFWNLRV